MKKPSLEEAIKRDLGNFTPAARNVLATAVRESVMLNHCFLSSEHVLLGISKLGKGLVAGILLKAGLTAEAIRNEIKKLVGMGPDNIPADAARNPTPRLKQILSCAEAEAKTLEHTYVGVEDILLAILQIETNCARRVIRNLNVDPEKIHLDILTGLNLTPSVLARLRKKQPANEESPGAQKVESIKKILKNLLKDFDRKRADHREAIILFIDVIIFGCSSLGELKILQETLTHFVGGNTKAILFVRSKFDAAETATEERNWGTILQRLTGKPVTKTIDYLAGWQSEP